MITEATGIARLELARQGDGFPPHATPIEIDEDAMGSKATETLGVNHNDMLLVSEKKSAPAAGAQPRSRRADRHARPGGRWTTSRAARRATRCSPA